jgi:hypothetical protein
MDLCMKKDVIKFINKKMYPATMNTGEPDKMQSIESKNDPPITFAYKRILNNNALVTSQKTTTDCIVKKNKIKMCLYDI